MNILLTNSTDIFAGGEDYVFILAKYLKHRGHRVWVSALPGHLLIDKCTQAGIDTLPVDYRGMGRVFSVAAVLRRAIRAQAINIVHSNANYDRTCAAIATAQTSALHVAGIHSNHSIQHNITHLLRNRHGTAHFITDADAGKEVLIREDGIPAERITTVPIGIENDSREFIASARRTTRAALRLTDDTVVIGNVARLVPFKGHSVLLEAAAATLQVHPNAAIVIIGDGELRDTLTYQAQSLGIAERVRFLGFRDDLQMLYPAFDIYCHSSLEMASEMFPIAILRALATGLPVVCTEVGGIATMVEQRVSGILVPPDSPSALSKALVEVLASRTLQSSMGRASFSLFQRKYHASAMAEKIEEVYKKV